MTHAQPTATTASTSGTRTTVLVTGAGGPAGVSIVRSLLAVPGVTVLASDMDAYASGLYLVPAGQRHLVRPGLAPDFVDHLLALCRATGVDVLFPTVDVELVPVARRRDEFAAIGVAVASPSLDTLEHTLDKYLLAQRCAGSEVPVPRTELLGVAYDWDYPVIVKPRSGSGSRGVHLVEDETALRALGTDERQIVQENLPGEEYSVDVIADLDGRVLAAVPRSRLRVDSGVAVAGRTVKDAELERTATAVAEQVGLTTVANVQLRRRADGTAALLEVNPRFPGAMPLTIAAGVDMPRLCLDMVLGVPLPETLTFRELANVRYLEDVFLDPADILPDLVPDVVPGPA